MTKKMNEFTEEELSKPEIRAKFGYKTGITGIILNVILCLAKIISGLLSGAISIVSDGINNLSDAGSSIITLFGFKLSEKKPDKEHPFGHGRMEYCAGLGVSIIILIVAIQLLMTSVEKIIAWETVPEQSSVTLAITFVILTLSIAAKFYLAVLNKTIGRKINSVAMLATAADSVSDCMATAVVLVSAILSLFIKNIPFDGFAGAVVSLFIAVSGIKSIKSVVDLLLGEAPDPALVKGVADYVQNYDKTKIIGIHDLMIHDYGPGRKIIVLHAEVPAEGNILQLHDVVDNVERGLEEKFNCLATIHMDPVVTTSPRLNAIKEECVKIVKEINPDFSLHDFRMNEGDTHANVIFDLVTPPENKTSARQIRKAVNEKLKLYDKKLNAIITVENSFV